MNSVPQSSTQTKIFGIRLGIDPKILVGALIGVAALLFWYNSRGDEQPRGTSAGAHVTEPTNTTPAFIAKSHGASQRRRGMHDDRGTLRLKPVDPTRGDIDPVLRLDLLERLSKVQAPSGTRNLFESGPAQMAQGMTPLPNRVIPVKTMPIAPVIASYPVASQIVANIPFKYYGFAKPLSPGEANRGFFMDGDNIIAAAEGQLIQQRYLVVQLTPNSAKLEDTQVKIGQTLQVVPEAAEQGGTGTAAFNQPANSGLNRPGMLQPGANPDEVNQ